MDKDKLREEFIKRFVEVGKYGDKPVPPMIVLNWFLSHLPQTETEEDCLCHHPELKHNIANEKIYHTRTSCGIFPPVGHTEKKTPRNPHDDEWIEQLDRVSDSHTEKKVISAGGWDGNEDDKSTIPEEKKCNCAYFRGHISAAWACPVHGYKEFVQTEKKLPEKLDDIALHNRTEELVVNKINEILDFLTK